MKVNNNQMDANVRAVDYHRNVCLIIRD